MKKSTKNQAKISTNLEKKNRQKIASSSAGVAADILTDFKLLSKFKKCHVRVARLSKNTLGKIAKKKEKPQKKVRATLIRGSVTKKKPDKKKDRPRKFPTAQAPAKTEKQVPHKKEHKQKAGPKSSKRNKEKKKQQIFIRLPLMENAKLKTLNKRKPYKKMAHPIRRLGKTYLTERFGSRFFRCHVKVARYRGPNDPAPKKKEKFNRKSVSFLETVEVFGESDDQSDDQSQPKDSPRTSTPAQTTVNSNNDTITISPSRRKVSLLKSAESPRSEHMRMSDEKVPRAKSVNTNSLVTKEDTNNTYQEAEGEEFPTVSGTEDSNEHESLNADETEHEILPEDERVNEEDEEEGKRQICDLTDEEDEDEGKGQICDLTDEEDEEEGKGQTCDLTDEEEEKGQICDITDEGNEEEKELDKMVVVSEDETAHNQNDDVRIGDEDREEMSDNEKDFMKKDDNKMETESVDEKVNTTETVTRNDDDQEGTSHQRTEGDHETCNDKPREEMEIAGNNNDSSHIELSSPYDRESDIFYDIGGSADPDNFTEADYQEKEFSLQISNNSEMSALCQKPEQNDPESDSVLSNADNIDTILDDTSDTPQAQQTKFSLNTFFKSLKTKIISQRTETIPPTKSSNQNNTERESDQTLRDELTIK